MLLTGSFDKYLLLVVASFGNVLGSSVNWYLGKKILIFKDKKWFPASETQIDFGNLFQKIRYLVFTTGLGTNYW